MTVTTGNRRMLLVHAHPDDETIGNGATMARYRAEGVHITLVTCTRGENGKVLDPGLSHLRADQSDTLGDFRVSELATAMRKVGVHDFRFLGGRGRYRDSGMAGAPENYRPDCFWQADLNEAADHLVEVIREVRPQVLVTYDDNGGYGHPDHIKAHRVAMRACELSADPAYRTELGDPWEISKVYWNRMARSVLTARLSAAEGHYPALAGPGDVSGVVDDQVITTVVDATQYASCKTAAMLAHASQISVCRDFFALSSGLWQPVIGQESYQLVRGDAGAELPEADLFAGITG